MTGEFYIIPNLNFKFWKNLKVEEFWPAMNREMLAGKRQQSSLLLSSPQPAVITLS
jgi:hypothetical protein